MLAAERRERIETALRSARVISTEELALLLDVSAETVRRDLIVLERSGKLSRVHGGALSASQLVSEEAPFSDRSATARQPKSAIGRAGAALVRPGQTVVFDVGTTVLEVARALPADFRGTVATCSLLVAAELASRPNIEVLVSGGRVRNGDLACSNAQTVAFFGDVRADIAFLGSGGVDVVAGLTDFHLDEVATRRMILANTALCYALADSTKLGAVAPHRVCDLDALAGLICDVRPAGSLEQALDRAGRIIVAA